VGSEEARKRLIRGGRARLLKSLGGGGGKSGRGGAQKNKSLARVSPEGPYRV